jgi:membrane-bound serine protease (ClpP class)
MDSKHSPLCFLKAILFFLITLPFLAWGATAEKAAQEVKREVLVVSVSGVINPVAAEFVAKSLKKASDMGAEALVIQLDTPGGLDTSMRSIVKDIIGSAVPVVVYVSPSGARAASAGVFITMAAHVAAMAPGTNIGAAHPVAVGEKMDKVMAEKATNDAAAYIRSIAEQRGRNAKWAEDAVRKSISATEKEALDKKIIDLVSKDLTTLLSEIDGGKVTVLQRERVLATRDVKIIREEVGFRHKILNLISDPTVAYILMLLGFYGIFFELTSPGSVFPGVVGAIALILAFYSFQTLPVNYAGLLLILTGIILFLLEVKVASYGALTVGGIISLVLGSLMLFDSPLPFFKLSLSIILPAATLTALFFILTFRLAYKAHKRKPSTGIEGLIGMEGTAKTDISESGGAVIVHGEVWSAFSDEPIQAQTKVVVEEVRGLALRVRQMGGR